jgi:hypothetical protein
MKKKNILLLKKEYPQINYFIFHSSNNHNLLLKLYLFIHFKLKLNSFIQFIQSSHYFNFLFFLFIISIT